MGWNWQRKKKKNKKENKWFVKKTNPDIYYKTTLISSQSMVLETFVLWRRYNNDFKTRDKFDNAIFISHG